MLWRITMKNMLTYAKALNLVVTFLLFINLGCTHKSANIKKRTFGELVFSSIVPGYLPGIITARTQKEGKLLEFVAWLAHDKINVNRVTLLYLTEDNLDNLRKNLKIEEQNKIISLNYFSYKITSNIDRAFIFLRDRDEIPEMLVLEYDEGKGLWYKENQAEEGG